MSNVSDPGKLDQGRRTPRWVLGVLLVSLMANMIIVGAVAGRIWLHHGGHGWFERHRHGEGMRSFLREVPEPRRAELKEMIQANRALVREDRNKVRELRKAVREAMLREPFDKTAVVTALGEVTSARQELATRFTTDLVQILERMSPAERKAFVDKVLRRHGGDRDDKP